MNFTRHDYETILYSLEGYIQGNDDDKLCDELVDICYRIERKLSDMDYTPSSDYKDKVDREYENHINTLTLYLGALSYDKRYAIDSN